jgi:hypothetical protein
MFVNPLNAMFFYVTAHAIVFRMQLWWQSGLLMPSHKERKLLQTGSTLRQFTTMVW